MAQQQKSQASDLLKILYPEYFANSALMDYRISFLRNHYLQIFPFSIIFSYKKADCYVNCCNDRNQNCPFYCIVFKRVEGRSANISVIKFSKKYQSNSTHFCPVCCVTVALGGAIKMGSLILRNTI